MFLAVSATADEDRAPDPLFQNDEILEVRIVAPFTTLLSNRDPEEELPATFRFTDSAGQTVDLDISIRVRGRFRRQKDICKFPPLRLNFKRPQTKGTLLHKQDKVKLVTHCQPTPAYERVLLREYAAYKILNVMTDASFRTRLLRITYIDSEDKKRDAVRYAFLIEHRDRLAKRIEKPLLDISATHPRTLNAEYSSTVALFHYLIGNTDFSSIRGPTAEMCCHNHVLFGDDKDSVWSVPYDFDQSGLVNAPYSSTNPRFKLRNAKQRLYRGRCIHIEHLETTVERYQDKRDEVLKVLDEVEAATRQSVKSMAIFVNKFYKTLDSDRRVQAELVKKCI